MTGVCVRERERRREREGTVGERTRSVDRPPKNSIFRYTLGSWGRVCDSDTSRPSLFRASVGCRSTHSSHLHISEGRGRFATLFSRFICIDDGTPYTM